jgi:Leucine-rich repeat (LRR) protein
MWRKRNYFLSFYQCWLLFWIVVCTQQQLVSSTTTSSTNYQFPSDELTALCDFYYSTNGPYWYYEGAPQWDCDSPTPQNPCTQSWEGITCTSDCSQSPCYVHEIKLVQYNLQGTLTSSLRNLTYLAILDFNGNKLSGTLPASWGSFENLNAVDLYDNRLTGSIPTEWLHMTHLQSLSLDRNHMTGPIPLYMLGHPSLLSLSMVANFLHGSFPEIPANYQNRSVLNTLVIGGNFITGTLPTTFPYLRHLTEFSISFALLTGTLPTEILLQTQLCKMDFSYNSLIGAISPSLGNVTNMLVFSVSGNFMTGAIPTTFENWTRVEYLLLSDNLLSGSIPPVLGNHVSLEYLQLAGNQLTGAIPSTFTQLQNLEVFAINNNELTGSVTDIFMNHPYLEELSFADNYFTGTVPSSLINSLSLQYLFLSSNRFSGTVPAFSSSAYAEIYLDNNLLTGTIPTSLSQLEDLEDFSISQNLITGTIPLYFSNMVSLQSLFLNQNELNGTIPRILGPVIEELYLNNNQLTSSIPHNFGDIEQLLEFSLETNYLTGSVPAFIQIAILQNVLMYGNYFTGTIEMAAFQHLKILDVSDNMFTTFNVQNSTSLQVINLNNNLFQGTVPSYLFENPNLVSVVLSGNCFYGTLPESVCFSPDLASLVLDGLHSSVTCVSRAISSIDNSGVLLNHGVDGSIPGCLFHMKRLHTLHLGGNAFYGSIPNIPENCSLTELVLASNQLTGTVPENVYIGKMSTLDLSLNRLEGTLPYDAFPHDTNISVKLKNNRLSGTIPSSLWNLPVNNVEILEGNLFECDADRHDLPVNDPKYKSYLCGSDSTNYSLVAFGAFLIVTVALLILFYLGHLRESMNTGVWYMHNLLYIQSQFVDFLGIAVWSALALIVFGSLSTIYSSYTNSYVWTISAAYKLGMPATVALFLMFCAGLAILIRYLAAHIDDGFDAKVISMKNCPRDLSAITVICQSFAWKDLFLIILNVVIVIIVNSAYVAGVRSNLTPVQFFSLAFFTSVFKVVWSWLLIRSSFTKSITESDRMILGLCLFNNLVAPFLAEVFISPDCLLYVITEPGSLTFFYNQLTPALVEITQDTYASIYSLVPKELSVLPPFHYSYQCSSSLVSSYTFVFIFRYVLSAILEPILVAFLLIVVPHSHSLDFILAPIWRVKRLQDFANNSEKYDEHLKWFEEFMAMSFRRRVISEVSTDLALLSSLGLIFPPLALIILFSLWKQMIEVKLALNRYDSIMDNVSDGGVRLHMLQIRCLIERELNEASRYITEGYWYGMVVATWLLAFILFDTMAPSVGTEGGIAIVVVMASSPWWLHYSIFLLGHRVTNLQDNFPRDDILNPVVVELSEFGIDKKDENRG